MKLLSNSRVVSILCWSSGNNQQIVSRLSLANQSLRRHSWDIDCQAFRSLDNLSICLKIMDYRTFYSPIITAVIRSILCCSCRIVLSDRMHCVGKQAKDSLFFFVRLLIVVISCQSTPNEILRLFSAVVFDRPFVLSNSIVSDANKTKSLLVIDISTCYCC